MSNKKRKYLLVSLAALGIAALALVVIITAAPPLLDRSIERSYADGDHYRASVLSFRLMKIREG